MHSHTIHFNNILQDSSFLLESLFIFWVWLELLMQKVFLFLENSGLIKVLHKLLDNTGIN